MKNRLWILATVAFALLGLASLVARADDLPPEVLKNANDILQTQLEKVQEWDAANGGIHSPEYSKTGIGLGAGLRHTNGDGTAADAAATFSSRIFKEGSQGKPDFQNAYNDPKTMRDAAVEANNSAIWDAVAWRYNSTNPKNLRGKLSEDEIDHRKREEADAMKEQLRAAIEPKAHQYDEAYAVMNKAYVEHAGARPLYLFEGSAAYNMIGKSQSGGAYTGINGSARAGLGFTFKDFGKNGCDIYFLGTGYVGAAGYYKLDEANSARAAVGIEQGVLCQIANTVTIMGSPSVQAGKFYHSSADGGPTAESDWLNYSARVRAIVDGRLYVAFESVLHPSMKKSSDPGAHWEASENSLTLDYALPNSPWVAGADLKAVTFHDENSGATGYRDINDNSLMLRAIRAF